ncbi:hypothetical protein DL96DRAFT_1708020 [Flagelloscypha sp. PMI_526]|nr:hypothetical protein DL96DRAFT_1708020 [Flagelloscypha sp. PMI_526]
MTLVHQIAFILMHVIVSCTSELFTSSYSPYNSLERLSYHIIESLCSLRLLEAGHVGALGYACTGIGVGGWLMTGQSYIKGNSINNDCHLSIDKPSAIRLAICYEVLFAYDTIIFLLTLYKTWRNPPSVVIGTPSQSLFTLLLRDGAFYFMFMALANLANILTFGLAPAFLRGRLSTFTSCLAVTLVSRMMLNLHRADTDMGILSTISGIMVFQDSREESSIGDSCLQEDPH